ncbi:SIR2 family protein [Pseudomonas aeruginosa]|uniref:SIR2 family protein n=1 Tax=Pseudomonas aeruginosa TaxID=287 RepID=UPI0012AF6AC3|nr:SIR2 family protein [Pseudomonas aeruginosa]
MIKTLTGPQFASTFCLRPEQFAWLLGAGASAAAGIPTGYSMILDFKKRLFCQLSKISLREVDANDPLWQQRIDLFFSTRSELPAPDDPTEYARAFEAVYPTAEDRRIYIEKAVTMGTPSFAHRVLATLLTTRRIPCVFTTNFDQLVETATTLTDQLVPANERASMTTAAIDNAERAERCLRESRWPFLAKLHGDFQSVELKNTTDELREQDVRMRNVLGAACARFGLVIVGYSGRDESVMAALTEALAQPNAFPGGIYWVTRSARSVLPAVKDLLEKVAQAGVTTALVESPTFDELAGDIIDGISLSPVLLQHVQDSRSAQILAELPLPAREQRSFPVLQCSAIPILAMPQQARRIEINAAITTVRARELAREARARVVVASIGREIAAFGSDAELLRAFAPVGGKIAGTIDLHPDTDSWALGLLYDALTWAISRGKPLLPRLRRKGHAIIVASGLPTDSPERVASRKEKLSRLGQAYSTPLSGKVEGYDYPFSEGVQIRLDRVADRWWCAFEPFTYVELPRAEAGDGANHDEANDNVASFVHRANPVMDWQRQRWAGRRNKEWARIIAGWARLLPGSNDGVVKAIGLREDSGPGQDAEFRLSPVTAWSRPSHDHDYFQRSGR